MQAGTTICCCRTSSRLRYTTRSLRLSGVGISIKGRTGVPDPVLTFARYQSGAELGFATRFLRRAVKVQLNIGLATRFLRPRQQAITRFLRRENNNEHDGFAEVGKPVMFVVIRQGLVLFSAAAGRRKKCLRP